MRLSVVGGLIAPPALLNPLLDAIRSTTYEVGFKSIPQPAGKAFVLGYDAALYDIEVTNEIVPYNGGRYISPRPRPDGRRPSSVSTPSQRSGCSATAR